MASIGPGLRYWLPETEFTVTAVRRKAVEAGDDGSRLVEVVDVDVAHAAVADRSNRRLLEMDAGILEKIDLAITLDDRGFVTAVNSAAGRDVAPVLSLVGKAISAAATVAILGFRKPDKKSKGETLEKAWAAKHAGLAARLTALLAQVDRLMAEMGDPQAAPGAIRAAARALDAVQSQAASVVAVRRAWIAAQAVEVGTATVRLRPFELVRVDGTELPEVLPAALPAQAPLRHAPLVGGFGCLLAIVDRERRAQPQVSDGTEADRDRLVIRRSRPATIGVYLERAGVWRLDPGSVQSIDVVDRFGEDDDVPLDGSWLRTRAVEFAYHPDMSLKTWGVKTVSAAASISTGLGEVLDASAKALKAAERPSAQARELARKKAEIDRLKTETEYEVLSATRERAAAVAVAEQVAKLRE